MLLYAHFGHFPTSGLFCIISEGLKIYTK